MTNTIKIIITIILLTISIGCWAVFTPSGSNVSSSKDSQWINHKTKNTNNWQSQDKYDTIGTLNKSQIKLWSSEGGASVFVNGFLVFSDQSKGTAISRLRMYLKPGVNTFEIVQNNADKNATLTVINFNEGDDPNLTKILLTLSTEDFDDTSAIGNLTMEDEALNFKWHEASGFDNSEASIDEIYNKLEALAKALKNGPDDDLIALLTIKHQEIAASVDYPKEAMDSGLLGGLETKRTNPKFSIDLVKREDFIPIVSSKETIVNAMGTNGEHAIQISDGSRSDGFSVSLGKINGEFEIVR